ncbi:hypothetical protein AURDEDRAFT_121565 [Auricularia subglabra TFB-10046 SS5]|nr:hypothetical protein AURDEDRAFT_121565 [Auricularia subglabra TFB-10046 SS5]
MAGRARPLEWKSSSISVKGLARKVADLYERRHDKAKPSSPGTHPSPTEHSGERRTVMSDAASTVHPTEHDYGNVAAWRSHSDVARLPPEPMSAKERRYRHEQGLDHAQRSFVSISDSLPSEESVEDAPEEPTAESHPEDLRKSLEALVLRAGCSTADPQLVDSLLGMVDQARRSDAQTVYSEGAQSSKRPARSPAAHRKRAYSHSHSQSNPTYSRPSTASDAPPRAPAVPRRHAARPLPPAPQPGTRSAPGTQVPAPPPSSTELPRAPRNVPDASQAAAGPSAPTTSTERETVIRSLSHDPAAVLALLQELVRQASPSPAVATRPAPRADGWSDQGSIRADSLPPYRRESPDTLPTQ